MGGFVHLHCHSPFSFLDGAARIEQLVEEAAALGMPAIALTDHNNLSGAVRWQQKAAAAGVKPIQGVELSLEHGHHLTLLATGPAGYASLCRLVTAAHLGHVPGDHDALGRPQDWNERRFAPRCALHHLARHAHGLIALSGCRRGEIPALLFQARYSEAAAAARRYRDLFGSGCFYLELQDNRLPGDAGLNRALRELGEALDIPLAATANVHYRTRQDFYIHDLLTCVRTLTRLDQVHPERRLNAENYLKSPAEMAATFRDFPGAVANTLAIAERCSPALNLGQRLHPGFPVPEGQTPAGYLRDLVYRGAAERYGRVTAAVTRRLEHELAIIEQLGFADYFLLVWDVCRFAREQRIRCAGRGSAADSAVAYCLFITDVDSIGRGLLFERFMSLERAETPDIDVDFDSRHRDRVADYVYRKYGAEHVAAVCTYNTYHARSAIRDLGKAMGFPPDTLDFLAKRMPFFSGADRIAELAGLLPELRRSGIPWEKLGPLLRACAAVARFPRFIGTHLGGLVIGRTPLMQVTPLQWAAKGVAVSQFDKEYVEDLGLIKLDLLSLRTLGAVDDAVAQINREQVRLQYDRIAPTDEETYELLRTGETVGVFQLESPAQRALQARLGADRFEDVVASVAIIRPGPIKGNMVEPFIARRHGLEPVTYLHPKLEPILAKTYGVVLFQEQVIEIATAVAGFTPGEADRLRRVMTHARSQDDMLAIGREFIDKAVVQGVEPAVAETIFSYIQGYASYGFCEAHAAAFADTAFKTAYLLRHYPAEFFAGLLSNQPMGYYPPNTLVWEARRRGVAVRPLDINRSRYEWVQEQEAAGPVPAPAPDGPPLPAGVAGAIRVGLKQVGGLGEKVARHIVAERESRGPFHSLADCCRRCAPAGGLARNDLEALVVAGAFDSLHPNRRELLWRLPHALEAARAEASAAAAAADGMQTSLGMAAEEEAPYTVSPPDFDAWERFIKEYQALGVMTGPHAMSFVRERLAAQGYLTAAGVKGQETGVPVRCAGVVIRPHRPPTRSGRTVVFFSLEDETGMIDVTVFEDVYQRDGHLIFQDPRPPLAVFGRVERRGRGVSITAFRIKELT